MGKDVKSQGGMEQAFEAWGADTQEKTEAAARLLEAMRMIELSGADLGFKLPGVAKLRALSFRTGPR